jgi:hypothetical protein
MITSRSVAIGLFVVVGLLSGCSADDSYEERQERRGLRVRNYPCRDQSVLLATTAGSPNEFTCPNRLHKMRVQVVTTSSNEEVAALVFCECQKEPRPELTNTQGESK